MFKNSWIFLIPIIVFAFLWFLPGLDFFKFSDNQTGQEHAFIYYGSIITLTLILAFIAYSKSNSALKQSKINYLLEIDERFCGSEIIHAREIIHEFYLTATELYPDFDNDQIKPIIGKMINDIHNNIGRKRDFIYLLNFLDFLETIGYLYVKKGVTIPELNELLGNSIVYFYEIYEPYIKHRRKKDPKFYDQFEKLYESVNRYQKCKVTQCGWCSIKLRIKCFILDKLSL